jgi:hypothetical protein
MINLLQQEYGNLPYDVKKKDNAIQQPFCLKSVHLSQRRQSVGIFVMPDLRLRQRCIDGAIFSTPALMERAQLCPSIVRALPEQRGKV